MGTPIRVSPSRPTSTDADTPDRDKEVLGRSTINCNRSSEPLSAQLRSWVEEVILPILLKEFFSD